jgi:hypothetical protein
MLKLDLVYQVVKLRNITLKLIKVSYKGLY